MDDELGISKASQYTASFQAEPCTPMMTFTGSNIEVCTWEDFWALCPQAMQTDQSCQPEKTPRREGHKIEGFKCSDCLTLKLATKLAPSGSPTAVD